MSEVPEFNRHRACAVLVAAGMLLVLCRAGVAQAAAETHDLSERYAARDSIVVEESETLQTDASFEAHPGKDDGVMLVGRERDEHTREIEWTVVSTDKDGPTRVQWDIKKHRHKRFVREPGESVERALRDGVGPLENYAVAEVWDGKRWKRQLHDGPPGALPAEMLQELMLVRTTRAHPLLPAKPVRVGDSWKPPVDAYLDGFAKGDDSPKLEAQCKLVRVDTRGEGEQQRRIAVCSVKISVQGAPVLPDPDNAAVWSKDARLEFTLNGEFEFDLKDQLLTRQSHTSVGTLKGRLVEGTKSTPVATETQCQWSVTRKRKAP